MPPRGRAAREVAAEGKDKTSAQVYFTTYAEAAGASWHHLIKFYSFPHRYSIETPK